MSDHYHYEYASDRHDHRGDYADQRHDHDGDYAELHHRHYDLEREDDSLRQEIRGLREAIATLSKELADAWTRIGELEQSRSVHGETLDDMRNRVYALEHDTPQARQLRYEADLAAADLAESGYGQPEPVGASRHGPGCLCPYCPDPDEPANRELEGATGEGSAR
jgi:chromosome segregation ATPase